MFKEIEVKFLEVDVPAVTAKLTELGAFDEGEDVLRETIFYDVGGVWLENRATRARVIRLRHNKRGAFLTYKNHYQGVLEADEIEFQVKNPEAAAALLENIGFPPHRRQEQKRRSFRLGSVKVDFNTWPRVPTYMELEGPSVEELQKTAGLLGLDWSKHSTEQSGRVVEKIYGIPLMTLRWYTFDRVE